MGGNIFTLRCAPPTEINHNIYQHVYEEVYRFRLFWFLFSFLFVWGCCPFVWVYSRRALYLTAPTFPILSCTCTGSIFTMPQYSFKCCNYFFMYITIVDYFVGSIYSRNLKINIRICSYGIIRY